GGLIQSVGASWMMSSIGSPTMVALVQASTALPFMLLSLVAGAVADRFDRRLVMVWAQSFMLIVSALLAGVAWMHWTTPVLLLIFTFLIGIGTVFNSPAWQVSVGEMVPRNELPGAISLNSMGFNIARAFGPAIGGAIVAAAGAAVAFGVNAVSYIGLIFVLLRWRPVRAPKTIADERLGAAIAAGLRYVAMSPDICVVLLRGGAFGVAGASVSALMPLIARDLVGGGALTFGLLLGAFGAGAVGGALLNVRLRSAWSAETLVIGSTVTYALATMALGLGLPLIATMALLAITGGGWVLMLSTFNVTVQMSAPRWVVARAVAVYQMLTFGGMAGGAWLWGLVAADRGVAAALIASGIATLLTAVLGLKWRMPQPEGLNLDPLMPHHEVDIALDIESRSGPIVISIEYEIDEQDVPAFLNAMADRRRIRRRDGARQWTLLRDLSDTRLWIERYRTPTWNDYLRHTRRITQADAAISARVRALHRGEAPPRIQRMIERQTGSLPIVTQVALGEMSDPMTDPTRAN
ncbi:MAG: major facilitator superfamily protein, partial [Sphingomonas bacterium]|nr:major facilitator superfamily protein [Sphingomonas bacterium]